MSSSTVRIGNQTSRYAPSWEAPFQYATEQGFDAFEWLSDGQKGWCEDMMHPQEIEGVTETARAHDIAFSVHAPWRSNPIRPEGRAAIEKSIDTAHWIHARLVNLHLWLESSAERFAQALVPITDMARRSGIRLSIENTPTTSPEEFNTLFDIVSSRDELRGHVGMCLDMGHANLFPGTQNDYLAFVDRLDPSVPIIHWHAHENPGDWDRHQTLFTGPSAADDRGIRGLVDRLKARSFEGMVIMEQWPSEPSELTVARKRLQELFAG